jgi:hypothetical protein
MKTKKGGRLIRMMKSVDIFGHPINLTYNREHTYQTVFGGLVSFIAGGLIIAYFLAQLYAMSSNSYTIKKSTIFKDLI